MLRILVADDEAKIRELVRKYAAFDGHSVTEAADGMEAVELCRKRDFDIVILDVMMPELDGFSAAREIRRDSRVPIIMLSARGEEYDRIHGFEAGADDYVTKPFSPRELMLRVAAVCGRARGGGAGPAAQVYQKDGFSINFTARSVTVDNAPAPLSPKECELLFYLVRNKGVALDRERLITNVWGYDFYGDDRTLDTHIKTLRRALGPYSGMIVTLRGLGYRWDG